MKAAPNDNHWGSLYLEFIFLVRFPADNADLFSRPASPEL